MNAPALSAAEAAKVAEFEAAPTPPEVWDQELWDAIAALVPCHPEGDCEYSDECECTANDVRDLMYRLAVAERYRQQADDPDDPEVNRVCCSMLVSNPFYRGTTTPNDAAVAVFRGQQDAAVQFAEWVVSLDDDDPESAGRQDRRTVTLSQIVDRARTAIGGDGR